MKPRILTLLMLICAAFTVSAQSYTVYSVTGTAKLAKGKQLIALSPRTELDAQSSIYIERESAVTVLDQHNNKMYSFTSAGQHKVGELVTKVEKHAKSVSKQYMSFMMKQLFSEGSQKMSHPDTYMQVTAMSYRSTSADSMLLRRIVDALQPSGKEAEQVLGDPTCELSTDLDVSFELISCESGLTVKDHAEQNMGCYVRVSNNTDQLLYVNLLNIDRQGNKYLVLPVDAAASCAHLIVPPTSTISFKSEPFIFNTGTSEEMYLLVATEEPVDFSILMSPIKAQQGKKLKLGLQRNFYHVE